MQKKRLLAADRPAGTQTVLDILGENFHVATVHSFAHAQELLSEPWDAILCGIHFADSKMFDFAEILGAHTTATGTPFVIFRDLDSELDATFFRSLKISTKVMGAADFVDLFDLKLQHGVDEADRIFRKIVLDIIDRRTL